jgi:SAM-dependent methyltransferase
LSKKIKRSVIILVLSYEGEPWAQLEREGIRKTWGSTVGSFPLVEVLYYYGGKDTLYREQDKLYAPFPEGFVNIGRKTLTALEYINSHYEYDFVFRINSSSYVDIFNYLRYISRYSSTQQLYCGLKCVPPPGDPRPVFASGCGYTLSNKTVNTVLEHKEKWDHSMIDDLALAKLLKSLDVEVTTAPRVDYGPQTNFTEDLAQGHFHVRCKCETNRQEDILRMNIVHKVYSRISKSAPLLNVLIRTSNRPYCFRRALSSVQSQGVLNLRIIVSVDNEASYNYVKAFPEVDTIVRCVHTPKESAGHAPYNLYTNRLLDEVKEGWVVFLDDDNVFTGQGVLGSVFFQHITDDSCIYLGKCLLKDRIVPSADHFGKQVVNGDIDTACMILPAAIAKKYQWPDRTGGDYTYLSRAIEGEGGMGAVRWVEEIIGYMPEGPRGGVKGDIPNEKKRCLVCGQESVYLNMLHRTQAICPTCGAFERHRVLAYFLKHLKNPTVHRILHIAPEAPVRKVLQGVYPQADYLTSSYPHKGGSSYCLDISKDIPLPAESFDVIVCSHVLEHVPDYHKAIKGLVRLLTPLGELYLMFPVRRGKTFEDATITSASARKEHYGQEDHLRFFGLDSMPELFNDYSYTALNPFMDVPAEEVPHINPTICDHLFVVRKKDKTWQKKKESQ